MTNGDIKRKAKADMKNGYGFAILTMILLNLVLVGSLTVGLFVGLLVTAGAVQCCYVAYFIDVAKHERKGIDSTYRGFRQFMRALVATLIQFAIIALPVGVLTFIETLLMIPLLQNGSAGASAAGLITFVFIVAIIVYVVGMSVKMYFTYYVMNDEVDLSGWECIRRSMKLAKGHFWKIVGFELSFLGWWILCLLTLGALMLYVTPYHYAAQANLYLALKEPDGKAAPKIPSDTAVVAASDPAADAETDSAAGSAAE